MPNVLNLPHTDGMGTWGNIGVGVLAFACGALLIAARRATDGYLPVAFLGFGMVIVGVLLIVMGVIGAGVKLGNEESPRR